MGSVIYSNKPIFKIQYEISDTSNQFYRFSISVHFQVPVKILEMYILFAILTVYLN